MAITVYTPDDNLLKDISSGLSLAAGTRRNRPYYESLDLFPNPERGFMTYTESHYYPSVTTDPESGVAIPTFAAVSQSDLIQARLTKHQTLVFRYYYMEKYRGQDTIEQAYLDLVSDDLAAIRAAGCKVIIRFAYSRYDPAGSYDPPYYADTTPARTLGHVAQLLPVINANADVVVGVNAGLIGIWGEWYYTENWGNKGNLTTQNWADRVQLLKAWIAGLSAPIVVGLRYPIVAKYMLAQGWISLAEFSRIGFHNDAFLASPGDWGTYDTDFRDEGTLIDTGDIAAQRAYLESIASGKLIGGESANADSGARTGWTAADTDLTQFRFTYLNPSWKPDLYATWGDSIQIAKRKLGYRLSLESGTFSIATTTAGSVEVSLKIRNTGYAPPSFNRPVLIVFDNGTTSYARSLSADIRTWTPGVTHTISGIIAAPSTAGAYQMYLALPDPDPTLATQPAFSIRLANHNVWDDTNGRNSLQQTVVVT